MRKESQEEEIHEKKRLMRRRFVVRKDEINEEKV